MKSNQSFYWDEHDLVLGSYVVSSSTKKKKTVFLLSTHKPILGTTMDDHKNKGAFYKLYDFTKGGTDIVDQRLGFNTCKFKSRKWSVFTFSKKSTRKSITFSSSYQAEVFCGT